MPRESLQSRVTRLDFPVHHGPAREPDAITMIVMHCTEGGTARSSIDYLNQTKDKVASYHYLIDRDGSILRMTPPTVVAYHAGDSAWPDPEPATAANPNRPNGGRSVNGRSIGIAWANNGEPLTTAQIESALWLCSIFPLVSPERIVGHYEVSPGRKTDPLPAMAMDTWRTLVSHYRSS